MLPEFPVKLGLLAGCSPMIIPGAVMAVNLLNQLAPLLLLHSTSYLKAFSIDQLQTLSLFFLNLQSQGYGISLLLFAFYFPIIGYLIYKSEFLPRILGVIYALAGLGYLVNSLVMFLYPHLSSHLFPYVLLPAFIGECSMSLWLIFKGIDVPKWEYYLTKQQTRPG